MYVCLVGLCDVFYFCMPRIPFVERRPNLDFEMYYREASMRVSGM